MDRILSVGKISTSRFKKEVDKTLSKNSYTDDFFQKKARQQKLRARSFFKLEQIDRQQNLIKKGNRYLDLGAYPGSWSEYIVKKTKGDVFLTLVDLVAVPPLVNYPTAKQRIIVGDVEKLSAKEVLPDDKRLYDGVLSDMAPQTTGQKDADSYASYQLVLGALRLAETVLAKDGFFLAKYLEGGEIDELKEIFKKKMGAFRIIRPKATRDASREIFLFCRKKA